MEPKQTEWKKCNSQVNLLDVFIFAYNPNGMALKHTWCILHSTTEKKKKKNEKQSDSICSHSWQERECPFFIANSFR